MSSEGGFLSILHAVPSEPFSLDENNPDISRWKNADVFQNNPLGLVVFLRSYEDLFQMVIRECEGKLRMMYLNV